MLYHSGGHSDACLHVPLASFRPGRTRNHGALCINVNLLPAQIQFPKPFVPTQAHTHTLTRSREPIYYIDAKHLRPSVYNLRTRREARVRFSVHKVAQARSHISRASAAAHTHTDNIHIHIPRFRDAHAGVHTCAHTKHVPTSPRICRPLRRGVANTNACRINAFISVCARASAGDWSK